MGWSARLGLSGLAACLLASGAWAAVGATQVAAAEGSIDGLRATGRVTSTPNSFWFGQMNKDGVCAVISGCTAARGDADNWVLSIQMPVAIPGGLSVDVSVKVTKRVPLKSMGLQLTYSSAQLGDLDASMTVGLKPKGRDTEVSLTMDSVKATGAIATGVPSFGAALQPRMTATMKELSDDRDIAGTDVNLSITGSGMAKVSVTGTGLSSKPPVARGRAYLVAGDEVVCTANISRSRGSCRLPKLPSGTQVRATVVGEFDNGYPIWNSDADEVK